MQELICSPRHTTVCQRARLCLKLKDISVSDGRPHATELLSGLRLATRFSSGSIADAQRMYRKPHRDGCRVVLKRASYLLLKVTPVDCTEAVQTLKGQRCVEAAVRTQAGTEERSLCAPSRSTRPSGKSTYLYTVWLHCAAAADNKQASERRLYCFSSLVN